MPRKQADAEKSLLNKGFQAGGGDHNFFVCHSQSGKKTMVRTKTSHGSKEIDDNLLARMSRQCKLSNKDFGQLVECPLGRENHEAKLILAGAMEAHPPEKG